MAGLTTRLSRGGCLGRDCSVDGTIGQTGPFREMEYDNERVLVGNLFRSHLRMKTPERRNVMSNKMTFWTMLLVAMLAMSMLVAGCAPNGALAIESGTDTHVDTELEDDWDEDAPTWRHAS